MIDQLKNAIRSGRNLFLTGAGGTGKTYVLNKILEENPYEFIITASTGIASKNISDKAITLSKFSGIGVTNCDVVLEGNSYEFLRLTVPESAREYISYCRRLVIEEVSMVSAGQLDTIDKLCRDIREEKNEPFGGIQVIILGDFLQLEPVITTEPKPEKIFAFESKVWNELNLYKIYLTEIKRTNDLFFAEMLHRIRMGRQTATDLEVLSATHTHKLEEPLRLYGTNYEVNAQNQKALSQNTGKEFELKGSFEGRFDDVKEILQDLRTPYSLKLKIGCKVMITVNERKYGNETGEDRELKYVNGTMGIFYGMGERVTSKQYKVKERRADGKMYETGEKRELVYQVALIKLNDGTHLELKKYKWEHPHDDRVSFTQYPLMVAESLTIHKCLSVDSYVSTKLGLLNYHELISDLKLSNLKKDIAKKINLKLNTKESYSIANKIAYSGQLNGYRIILENDQEIKISKDHFLLTDGPEGLSYDANYEIGKKVAIKINNTIFPNKYQFAKFIKSNKAINEKVAYLLGAFIGDGYCNDKIDNSIQFTNPDKVILDKVYDYTESEFSYTPKKYFYKEKCPKIYIISKEVRGYFSNIGLPYSTAKTKKIPLSIRKSPKSVVCSFLKGLFETDGGVNKNCIHYTSISKDLISDLQLILVNIGIVSSVKLLKPLKVKGNSEYLAYRLQISGRFVLDFINHIGFDEPKRKKKALDIISKLTNVPKSNRSFITNGSDYMIKLRSLIKKENLHKSIDSNVLKLMSRIIRKRVNLSTYHIDYIIERLPETIIKSKEVETLKEYQGLYLLKIKEIKNCKIEAFDMSVCNHHNYIANGIVSHNCQGLTLDEVEVDCKKITQPNQFYVAVSRARSLEGLRIINFHPRVITTSKKALAFYEELEREMSTRNHQHEAQV